MEQLLRTKIIINIYRYIIIMIDCTLYHRRARHLAHCVLLGLYTIFILKMHNYIDVTSNISTSYFTQIYTSCSIHVAAITRVQFPYSYKMHAHSYRPSRCLLDYPAKTPLIPLSRISTSNSHILSCVLHAMCACAI